MVHTIVVAAWLIILAMAAMANAQAVEGFSPRSGPQTGQTLITIVGKVFRETGKIRLMFSNANDRQDFPVLYINENTMICTTGSFNSTGDFDVAVTFDGNSYQSLPVRFIVYSNTFPDSFEPLSGPVAGGSDLKILGKFVNTGEIRLLFDIFNEEYVYFDAVFVDEFTLRSTTRRFNKPGKYDVNIALNGQQFVSFSEFYIAYDQDLLTSFNPTSGSVSGGQRFVISGSGISDTGEHTVAFVDARGQRTAVFADYVDSNTLSCVTPAFSSTGTYTVEVAQNGQDYEKMNGSFIVY